MGQFSLREVFLVTTVFAIAMAVNLWSHGELRDRLEASEQHAMQLQRQADRLHSVLTDAKGDHEAHQRQVQGWIASGELRIKHAPEAWCGCVPDEPDWNVLKDYTPSKAR
jgi:uncharacterized protein YhaN